ncbi:hypothetical protein Lal_00024646 [Lupinus albus]|nr:hypothetical protein Lal_00024646 [Lupinus albus]
MKAENSQHSKRPVCAKTASKEEYVGEELCMEELPSALLLLLLSVPVSSKFPPKFLLSFIGYQIAISKEEWTPFLVASLIQILVVLSHGSNTHMWPHIWPQSTRSHISSST